MYHELIFKFAKLLPSVSLKGAMTLRVYGTVKAANFTEDHGFYLQNEFFRSFSIYSCFLLFLEPSKF